MLNLSRRGTLGLAVLALAQGAGTLAAADELVILSGGAVKSGIVATIAEFEKSSGHKVAAEFAPMGGLTRKLADGATPDVVVVTVEVMDDLLKKGWVVPGTITEIGRVGVGIAVNEKALSPDISTPEAFKATLLAAKSIVMIDPATGTSGKHLADVFAKLGITDAIRARTTYLQGGYVVERVGTGEIELGLHQITEILPVKGIKLVGPLPADLQKITIYSGAVSTKSKSPDAAKAFLAHMQSSAVRASLGRMGFMSP